MADSNPVAAPLGGTRKLMDRAWDIMLKVTVPVTTLIAGTIVAHEIRLTRIESTSFTKKDGFALERDLKEWVDVRIQPAWRPEDLTEIKGVLRSISDRLHSVEGKLNGR